MIDTSKAQVSKSLSKEALLEISQKKDGGISLPTALKNCKSLTLGLRNVKFMYASRPDQMVLKGLSLDVKPSCITAICGRWANRKVKHYIYSILFSLLFKSIHLLSLL